MKKIRELVFNRWVLGGLVVAAAPLVVLLVGDAIASSTIGPLETLLARWVLVSIVILCWLAWELVARLAHPPRPTRACSGLAGAAGDDSSARSAQERHAAGQRFEEAVGGAGTPASRARPAKRQSLYQLPWYMIIGPPGSGKTTALINSGLRFPLAERSGSDAMQRRRRHAQLRLVVHRRGGAARHRRPLHHAGQRPRGDAAAWHGFLDLLKQLPAAPAAQRRDRHASASPT